MKRYIRAAKQRAKAKQQSAVDITESGPEQHTAPPTVTTYYYPRINGHARGRRPREYCEGMVDYAIEFGVGLTEIIEVTERHGDTPGVAQSKATRRVVRSSRPAAQPTHEEADAIRAHSERAPAHVCCDPDPLTTEWHMALAGWDEYVTRRRQSDPSAEEA